MSSPAYVSDIRNLWKSKWFLWWCVAAVALVTSLAVVPLVHGMLWTDKDASVPSWFNVVSGFFQASSVAVTFFLVLLTNNLFSLASEVNKNSERFHRIAMLPLLVAKPSGKLDTTGSFTFLNFDIQNVGEGPAVDVSVEMTIADRRDEDDSIVERQGFSGNEYFVALPKKQVEVAGFALPGGDFDTDTFVQVAIAYHDLYGAPARTVMTWEFIPQINTIERESDGVMTEEITVTGYELGAPDVLVLDPPAVDAVVDSAGLMSIHDPSGSRHTSWKNRVAAYRGLDL